MERNFHWIMWIQRIQRIWGITEAWIGFSKDLLCYLCLSGLVVSSLSLTQEILGSNPTLLIFYLKFFFVTEFTELNSVKAFRENSTDSASLVCVGQKISEVSFVHAPLHILDFGHF